MDFDSLPKATADDIRRALAARSGQSVEEIQGSFAGQEARPNATFTGQSNRAIADVFGAPADLIGGGVNMAREAFGAEPVAPIGGSESIADMLRFFGFNVDQPDAALNDPSAFVGRGIGEAASTLIPLGAAAKLAKSAGGVVGGLANSFNNAAVRAPAATIAADTTAGVTSGAGSYAGAELAPSLGIERDTGADIGAVVGALGSSPIASGATSLATGVPFTRRIARTAVNTVRDARLPLTRAGREELAGRSIRKAAENLPNARDALDAPKDEFSDLLTPFQQTGDLGLMALERSAAREIPAMRDYFRNRTGEATERFRQELLEAGGGVQGEEATEYLARKVETYVDAIGRQAEQATMLADEAIAAAGPRLGASRMELSTGVRTKIEEADDAAYEAVQDAWLQVPKDVTVDARPLLDRFDALVDEYGDELGEHIPATAKKILADPETPYIGDISSRRVANFYSAMRTAARHSAAGVAPPEQLVRAANKLAETALDVLNDGPRALSAPYQVARTATKEYHDLFARSRIGEVLRSRASGAPTVAPERTLDALVAPAGARGALGVRDAEKAVGTDPDAMAMIEDFFRDTFLDRTTRGSGERFNPDQASRFVRDRSDALEYFPQARQQMDTAIDASRSAEQAAALAKEQTAALSRSPIAALADAPLAREFDTILSAKNPVSAAKEVVLELGSEPTGRALAGLRTAAGDYISRQTFLHKDGFYSGEKMLSLLADKRVGGALREVFPPDHIQRLEQVARAASSLEDAMRAAAPKLEQNATAILMTLMTRPLAARAGAWFGRGAQSLQAAGFFSNQMKRFNEWVSNIDSKAILQEAARNPELLRRLMDEPPTPQELKAIAASLAGAKSPIQAATAGVGVSRDRDLEEPYDPFSELEQFILD